MKEFLEFIIRQLVEYPDEMMLSEIPSGKTTIFNLLTGVYEPTSGELYFQGERIDGLKPYEISRRGISRTFQNIRLFPSMSVLENVMTACHRHAKQNLLDAVLRLPL